MSINHQFFEAMKEACSIGQSKRSYRAQAQTAKLDKIFSYSSFNSIRETSKQFAGFLKKEGVTRADQVTPTLVNAFMEEKAANCNNNTLTKIKTHLESLGRFCSRRWGVEAANFSPTGRFEGLKAQNIKVGRPMAQKAIQTILEGLESHGRAGQRTARAVRLIRGTGLRIQECAYQKPADCHPDERGLFGFGYIDVSEPKHGRPRRIHLVSAAGREAVKEAMAHAKDGRLFQCTTKTLQNSLAAAKQAIPGLDLQGAHSIRKAWAQECYDFYRERHTRREAIQFVNTQLGHGAGRDVSELKTYVANIW